MDGNVDDGIQVNQYISGLELMQDRLQRHIDNWCLLRRTYTQLERDFFLDPTDTLSFHYIYISRFHDNSNTTPLICPSSNLHPS